MKVWSAAAGAVLMSSLMFAPPAAAGPAPDCGGEHWVGSWMAAPSDAFSAADPSLVPQLSATDQTYRLIVTPHRGVRPCACT
ncbi:hypothetical protein [Nocardia thailandica]